MHSGLGQLAEVGKLGAYAWPAIQGNLPQIVQRMRADVVSVFDVCNAQAAEHQRLAKQVQLLEAQTIKLEKKVAAQDKTMAKLHRIADNAMEQRNAAVKRLAEAVPEMVVPETNAAPGSQVNDATTNPTQGEETLVDTEKKDETTPDAEKARDMMPDAEKKDDMMQDYHPVNDENDNENNKTKDDTDKVMF